MLFGGKNDGRRFWKSNLGVLMISSGLWRIGGRMTWPFWALYVLYLGGDHFHVGLISAISSVAGIIPILLGGYLVDVFGRKKMMYTMSFLLSFNTIFYYLAPSWEWLLFARFMDAIYGGFRQPAFSAILADSTTAEKRALSYGMWHAIPPVFGLFSPYLIGVLMDKYGVLPAQRWAYLILLGTSSLGAYLRYRYLSETLPPRSAKKLSIFTIVRETINDFKETTRIIPRQLWVLVLMGIIFQFGVSSGGIFLVTYATDDVIHLTASEWGLINTAAMIVSMVVAMPSAALADRLGRNKIVIFSLFLTPIFLVGFVNSKAFMSTFIFYILMTILGSIGSVSSQALFIDFSSKKHRGRISALTSVIGATQNFNFQGAGGGSLVGALGNIIGGTLYEKMSYAIPFYLMAVMIGFTAVIGSIFVKEPTEREE